MKKVVGVGPVILFILFLLKGIIVPITVLVTALILAAISGLFFDKREDDIGSEKI